jgi:hypothetical protein
MHAEFDRSGEGFSTAVASKDSPARTAVGHKLPLLGHWLERKQLFRRPDRVLGL